MRRRRNKEWKVGDAVVMVDRSDPHFHGQPATIIDIRQRKGAPSLSYTVKLRRGGEAYVTEGMLREPSGSQGSRSPNSSEKSLYQKLRDAGATLDHHESDLYVLATPETREILREWRTEQKHAGVAYTTFQSEGKTWFDVPFAHEPFWEKKSRRPNAKTEKSCGFAISFGSEQMIQSTAHDFVEEHGVPKSFRKFVTKDGKITPAGWQKLTEDILKVESNALAWLRKNFLRVRDDGHAGDELVGSVWYDPADKEQLALIELASPAPGRGERIDFKDSSYGGFSDSESFKGVDDFGYQLLDGFIVFFDVDEEF